MRSILNHGRHRDLHPSQRHTIQHAEIVAHNAGLAIYREMRKALPDGLRDLAMPVALIGLISAIGRLLAACEDQDRAGDIAINLGEVVPNEIAYWREKRSY